METKNLIPAILIEQIHENGMSELFGGTEFIPIQDANINNGRTCDEINNGVNCDVINNGTVCSLINNNKTCAVINNESSCKDS